MRSHVQYYIGEVVLVPKLKQTGIVIESYMALDPLIPFTRVYVVSVKHDKVRILYSDDLQKINKSDIIKIEKRCKKCLN